MSRVFIVEEQRNEYDYSSALRYGHLTYIWTPAERRPGIFQIPEYCSAVIKRLEEMRYNPNKDYLLVVGNIIPNILTILEMFRSFGIVNLLLYDTRDRIYKVATVKRSDYDGESL